jgi:hypothetical protein
MRLAAELYLFCNAGGHLAVGRGWQLNSAPRPFGPAEGRAMTLIEAVAFAVEAQ